MAEIVYGLCVALSLLCAVLLVRAHRERGGALLAWSAVCFVGLAMGSVALLVDFELGDSADLSVLRAGITAASMLALVIGLVWSSVEVRR